MGNHWFQVKGPLTACFRPQSSSQRLFAIDFCLCFGLSHPSSPRAGQILAFSLKKSKLITGSQMPLPVCPVWGSHPYWKNWGGEKWSQGTLGSGRGPEAVMRDGGLGSSLLPTLQTRFAKWRGGFPKEGWGCPCEEDESMAGLQLRKKRGWENKCFEHMGEKNYIYIYI